MILDSRELTGDPASLRAGVIIVGGGTVGLSMAVALARAGCDVLALEAGPATVSKESQRLFEAARNLGHRLDGLHQGRFRAFGGTSNFWGGQLVKFEPIVFGPRPWASEFAGWPISHDDVAPYYRKVFALVGMAKADDDDSAVAARLGTAPPALPDDLEFFFSRWAPEPNFARLYENEIRRLPNLRVVTEAQVAALRLAASGRVAGVEAALGDGRRLRFDATDVVLANGTIEIARLLALPLADGGQTPWSGNPWIGRGFTDHIDFAVGDVRLKDRKRFHCLFDNAVLDGLKHQPKLKLSQAAQRERKLLGAAAYFSFRSSLAENVANAKIFLKGLLNGRIDRGLSVGALRDALRVGAPMLLHYLWRRRIYNPADLGVELRLTCEQLPVAESGIRLRSERDVFGMPMVDMDWRISGGEIETLAFLGEAVAGYLRDAGLAEVELRPALAARDPAFVAEFLDANHQIGMARMASSPARGVVDAHLRVHGVANLHVAGAAVFPSAGFANPTFTALALGLRLAERLTQERAR